MAKAKASLKVTKGVFEAAKLLLENGATNGEIAKYLKISTDVVTFIRKAETYEEYQTIMYEYSLKQRQREAARVAAIKAKETPKEEPPQIVPQTTPQIVEHRQTVTVQATWQMTQEMQKTNELLRLISNKLAYIVDELCGVKTDAKPDH